MKYYAAVDKDGSNNIFLGMPIRNGVTWGGERASFTIHLNGFPNLHWTSAPVEVELSIKVVSK